VTERLVNVPTDVILGWAAFVTLWAVPTVLTLAPFMFEIAEPFPVIRLVTIEFKFEIPETSRDVRVPTEVILGCEGFVTLEATFAAATFPIRLDEFMFEIPEPLDTTSRPLIVSPVRVPTEVTFG
jgi:hypothetical protein